MATATVAIPSSALSPPPAPKVQSAQAPSVFPFSTEQEYLYDLYHSDHIYYRVQREYLFWRECFNSRSFLKQACSSITLGAVVGGLTGFVASKVLKNDEDEEKNRERTLTFTTWAAGIGGGIAALLKGGKTIAELKQSPEYNQWKGEAVMSEIFPLFQQFLKESPELQDFVCDLTGDLITHPLRAPNGKIYEKRAIEEWLSNQAALYPPERLETMTPEKRREAELCFCPARSCYLKIEMLKYDFEYHQKVLTALKAALDKTIQKEFAEGLHKYDTAIRKNRKELMKEYVTEFSAQFTSGEMSEKAFQDAVSRCREHYALPR